MDNKEIIRALNILDEASEEFPLFEFERSLNGMVVYSAEGHFAGKLFVYELTMAFEEGFFEPLHPIYELIELIELFHVKCRLNIYETEVISLVQLYFRCLYLLAYSTHSRSLSHLCFSKNL